MNLLNIGIIGTRGIPNQYGGFEQAAEFLATGLVDKGHSVTVYNPHNHSFNKTDYKGVRIAHCYDPENILGTAGQFIYDLNCIRDASRRNFDILLFLGYTSSSLWWRFFPKNTVVVSNMDGLEWKRSKYNGAVQKFLKYAERLAVNHSQFLVSDSKGIQNYLLESYEKKSEFIPYGADQRREEIPSVWNEYKLRPREYYMLMARMEPENNIDMVLEGFSVSGSNSEFVVTGNNNNKYGRWIKKKYGKDKRIRFTGSIYEQDKVHTLRKYCSMYFHGHSVGGTNPSLLEAMSSGTVIAAHHNIFNRSVLGNDAYYFSNPAEIAALINSPANDDEYRNMTENNHRKIREIYNWKNVVDHYEQFLVNCFQKSRK